MQYRSPPVSRGPSSKTCPRWLSPCPEPPSEPSAGSVRLSVLPHPPPFVVFACPASAAISPRRSSTRPRSDPYPAASISSRGTNRSDAELMQDRSPPVSRGPSSNTCPRWLSPCTERTSVRIFPCDESRTSLTCAGTIGVLKLGQPQPDSNFDDDANSGSPETMST